MIAQIFMAIVIICIGLQVFVALAANTHNTRMKSLVHRAEVIVKAIHQAENDIPTIKTQGIESLLAYAKEVGIKLNEDQAKEFISYWMHELDLIEQKDEGQNAA